MRLICTVKECDIGLITHNSITSVSWGLGESFFGHITPFKQQREWVCCFYLCTLNTAVYFTQKQKNVSKWLKVCQKNTQLDRFHTKKYWGLKNTQSKTKLWTKEYHGEYNISSTHVIDLNLKLLQNAFCILLHQFKTRIAKEQLNTTPAWDTISSHDRCTYKNVIGV